MVGVGVVMLWEWGVEGRIYICVCVCMCVGGKILP